MRLYLASTSPARLALLRQVGIEPIVVPSRVDEDAAVAAETARIGPLNPAAMVQLLARLKAEAIMAELPNGEPIDGVILGGDSAFEINGITYGKPHEPQIARERWLAQRGKTGTLHSGHWLIDHRQGHQTRATGGVAAASVSFADDISDAEIAAYIATGEPLNVAGAFTIDGLAAPFITEIVGAPSTVVGMSLPLVRSLLGDLGLSWVDFWTD